MVRTAIAMPDYSVKVILYRNSETESIAFCGIGNVAPMDAFDYAVQAQGYFRFAIQDMDADRIEIDIRNGVGTIELIEITRD